MYHKIIRALAISAVAVSAIVAVSPITASPVSAGEPPKNGTRCLALYNSSDNSFLIFRVNSTTDQQVGATRTSNTLPPNCYVIGEIGDNDNVG